MKKNTEQKKINPWPFCEEYSLKYQSLGEAALAKREAALVTLAGGEGTRLGYDGPKGVFPITLKTKKSLFELFARKLLRLEKKCGAPIYWVLMLSLKNEKETLAFFQKHNYFGLQKSQILFFTQQNLPYLDENDQPIKNSAGKTLSGSNGNGALLEDIKTSKVLEKLKQAGVKYLQVVPVDNPIFNPLDPVFLGFHLEHKNDVSLIALKKEDGLNHMGALAEENKDQTKKLKIIEYLYLPKDITFSYVNSALFLFNLEFIEKHSFADLPIHKVLKEVVLQKTENIDSLKNSNSLKNSKNQQEQKDQKSQKNQQGPENRKEKKLKIYKSEKFIFDALDYAQKASAIVYPRKECFVPLKRVEDLPVIQKIFLEKKDSIYL